MPRPLIAVSRPNFLTLTLACILLAASLTWYQQQALPFWRTGWVLVLALLAHISVNALNEYEDWRSGLDQHTLKTPFSGGSGALVRQPEAAPLALWWGCLSLALVVVGGLWLTAQVSWQLLWLGIPGVLLIWSYTRYLNRQPVACYLAPGAGFGLVMFPGATYVLGGELSAGTWVTGLIVLLAVSNLLLLNQFPDVAADRRAGRRHLPILLGPRAAAHWWLGAWLSAALLLGLGTGLTILPAGSVWLIGVLAVVPVIWHRLLKVGFSWQELPILLFSQVVLVHVLLLGLALVWLLAAGS